MGRSSPHGETDEIEHSRGLRRAGRNWHRDYACGDHRTVLTHDCGLDREPAIGAQSREHDKQMTQLPVETIDPIMQRLRTLAQDLPDLKDAAQVYEIILPLLRDADLCVTPIALTADQARGKLEMGLPLLHDLNLELDAKAACNLMLRLACALETTIEESRPPQLAMAARWIQLALEDNDLDFSVLVPHVATGDKEFVITLAQSLQLNSDLLWTLAQNTLKPALRVWRRQLATFAEGIPWRKGYCYI